MNGDAGLIVARHSGIIACFPINPATGLDFMWFKNLRLYRFTQPFTLSAEALEEKLAQIPFVPCSNYEKSRLGWISPLPETDGEEEPPLTHTVGQYTMLCARRQERLLPASVVREVTADKVAELEQRQARKIYRKERKQIQEDVTAALLPQAFTRSQRTYAYLAPQENLLVVDAATATRAEEIITLMRDALGSLPVALTETKRNPSDVMTRWLQQGKGSDHFLLNEDCELYNPRDGSNVVRCKGQDLESDEISVHLEAGKRVKSLGVSWNSLLSCVIDDELAVKRLRFEEMREESEGFQEESAVQKFDQEFALMTLELAKFFESLFKAFGGLEAPKQDAQTGTDTKAVE